MTKTLALVALLAGAIATPHLALAQAEPAAEQAGEKSPTPKLGEVFPDFAGKTFDGKDVSLSANKAKIVLVDFWATWCGPCLAKLPTVRRAYADFHDKGFDIIAISLDRDDNRLQEFYANAETTLPWPSIYDGKFWQAELARRFDIRAIPALFLLDENRNIIATSNELEGNSLLKILGERLDPTYVVPPTVKELLESYGKTPEAEREALAAKILAESKANQMGAAEAVWITLEKSQATDPQVAKLALAMLEPTIKAGKDWATLDTAALAAHHAGEPVRAEEIQALAVKQLESRVKARQPDATTEQLLQIEPYVELSIRLALYRAANGKKEEAQGMLKQFNAVLEDESPMRTSPYYSKLVELTK